MISSFTGPHRFLSNFWPSAVTLDGDEYRTIEHAYQAAKTLDMHERILVRSAVTPSAAKRMGRRLTIRPDWGGIKIAVMQGLLIQKFRMASPLATQLLATDDEELVEGNNWNDRFWGQCPIGTGDNHLGKLLMQIREGLRT